MSNKVKSFGAGSILTAILIFILTGVFGWVGLETTKVPHISRSIQRIDGINEKLITVMRQTDVMDKKIDWMYRSIEQMVNDSKKKCDDHEKRLMILESEVRLLIKKQKGE